jgi:hypothetical protein
MAMPIINAPAMRPVIPGRDVDRAPRAVIPVVVVAVWIVRGITVAIVSEPDRKAKSDPH